MVFDNTLWKNQVLSPRTAISQSLAEFNSLLTQDRSYRSILLPIRDGVAIVYPQPEQE